MEIPIPPKKLLRHKPKYQYCGLTIIMSNPSRFDRSELISGVAGYYFQNNCLQPETTMNHCDIRLIDDKSPLLPGTKCILLLGVKAFHDYTGKYQSSLDENRGSPLIINGIVCIPSFAPQDAVDMKDYESRFNDELTEEDDDDEKAQDDVIANKARGKTARSNYRFWLRQDVKKAIRIVSNDGKLPELYKSEPNYHINPEWQTVVDRLENANGKFVYFDMETDFYSIDMRCFAFSISDDPFNIFVVPTLTLDYKQYYGENQKYIYRALAKAAKRNTLVAHNGANFDFLVMAFKYHIPVNKVYDTLIAQHRIYPTVEKSLGHCVSLWTYEPFHKDTGNHVYKTREQAQQLYLYCGKDVFTMYLIHQAQEDLMVQDPGLRASINLANDAIVPYMMASYLGMYYSEADRQKWIQSNDRLMNKYLEILQYLIGPNVQPLISNKKCVKYFHELMKYPVAKRNKKGNPSLDADALYRLEIKVKTPVIKFLIKYREVQKETGTLMFKPWSDAKPHLKLNHPRDCTQYIINGAETFRLGSRMMLQSRNKWDNRNYGGNRQNLEKSTRQLWRADDGYLLCQVDQAGAEALIVAHLCRDGKYRSLFQNGIKPHTYLALKLFADIWKKHIDPNVVDEMLKLDVPSLKAHSRWKEIATIIADSDNWDSAERYYHFAKKTIHAGSYGMMGNTFRIQMLKESAGQINLKKEQADLFLMGFHKEFPEIRSWHSDTLQTIKRKGQLRNLFNFPFNITNYVNPDDFKDLIAWVPQSTVACITRQAFVRLQAFIEKENRNWHLLHDTHDSYLCEAPEQEIKELATKMKEFMEIELVAPSDGTIFRMKSAASIGKNWAPFKEGKNPEGLIEIK